jgi:Tetracyclin repressor-like, C-terminal domain
MAMFQERLDRDATTPESGVAPTTAQDALKLKVRGFVGKLNGLFGKVMAELIAEGQSDPAILEALYGRHLRERRAATVAEVKRAQAAGELPADVDPELVVDAISGPLYYHLLMRHQPLTETYADDPGGTGIPLLKVPLLQPRHVLVAPHPRPTESNTVPSP